MIPDFMRHLPTVGDLPVPFFVAMVDGKYDLRLADPRKVIRVAMEDLCWVCGKPRTPGVGVFIMGPISLANRYTSEGPCHLQCADYSMQACPFLNGSTKAYRHTRLPTGTEDAAGNLFLHPPAQAAVAADSFTVFRDPGTGYPVYRLSQQGVVQWWKDGVRITDDEAHSLCSAWGPYATYIKERREQEERKSRILRRAGRKRRG